MSVFVVLGLLMCPPIKVTNHTNFWDSMDQKNLEVAIVRCGKIYNDSPCVKQFFKMEKQVYRVICGRP